MATFYGTLGAAGKLHLSADSIVKHFIKGVAHISPPPVRRIPTWDLHLVLNALTRPPFEPLATVPFKILSVKTLFLVAVTSARRVSELGALSVHPDL